MSSRRLTALAAAALVMTVGVASVHATPIIASGSGLAAPDWTITFSEVALSNGAVLTNEYAAYGVTFSPNAYYDPQPGFFGTPSVGNYSFCCGATVSPVTLTFSQVLAGAAFQFITNVNTTTFTSYLSGVPVETFSSPTSINYLWYGFANSAFDRIDISVSGDTFFLMDNLQVEPVPEPGTLLLLGSGVTALVLRRRRKA